MHDSPEQSGQDGPSSAVPASGQSPLVLCIGGHDPSGGAGIQADIETCIALRTRAATLVTCLTEQDSANVHALIPLDPAIFAACRDRLLTDLQPVVVKVGLAGSAALCREVATAVPADVPLVLDPVLAAGGGTDLADRELLGALRAQLLPRAALLTPNRAEIRRLSGLADPDAAAAWCLEQGVSAVLLTGADEATGGTVRNRLYLADGTQDFDWPLLPGSYHGSGCTLASACAAWLARGLDTVAASAAAQDFTWRTLEAAERPGRGQALPTRCAGV